MEKTFNILFLVSMVILTACSSFSEKVVSRIDGVDKRPVWASEGKAMFIKDGRIYSIGHVEVDGTSSVSSSMRLADNNARFEISRLVTNSLSFMFQNAEEGVSGDTSMTRFYGNELSKFNSNGIRQEERYWEKVLVSNPDGDKELKLRIYSLASIQESDVKKAIKAILDKNKMLSPAMQKAVDDHMTSQISNMQ